MYSSLVMLLCKIDRDRLSTRVLSFVNHTFVIIEFEFTSPLGKEVREEEEEGIRMKGKFV